VYLDEMPNLFLGYICGGIYFTFIIYIILLPIKEDARIDRN
jgi:hypothetical protein